MKNTTRISVVLAAVIFYLFGCIPQKNNDPKAKIFEVQFAKVPASENDLDRTLQSLVKVRDISEQYATGGIYLITQYGDRDSLFQEENKNAMSEIMFKQPWRFCSMFSVKNDQGAIMGRNWDNQNVGSILVSYYKPEYGYASVNFARAIDMDFPMNVDLVEMTGSPFGQALALAPFYTYDGMNEAGLCVGVTGISTASTEASDSLPSVFIGYLTRLVLDQASNVKEAIKIMKGYIPFDLDKNLISAHWLLADKTGSSVVAEYMVHGWKITPGNNQRQVMTNKVITGVADSTLREKCWRYKSLSETLDRSANQITWQDGWQMLKDVTQKGTTWTVVYTLSNGEMYFSGYQDWSRIYHLTPFIPEN